MSKRPTGERRFLGRSMRYAAGSVDTDNQTRGKPARVPRHPRRAIRFWLSRARLGNPQESGHCHRYCWGVDGQGAPKHAQTQKQPRRWSCGSCSRGALLGGMQQRGAIDSSECEGHFDSAYDERSIRANVHQPHEIRPTLSIQLSRWSVHSGCRSIHGGTR